MISLLIFAALLAGIFFCCRSPAQAARRAETPSTVKAGYYYDSDFMYKSSDGSYCGYDIEYLYEVAKYSNWQYEFVEFGSFEDTLAALEAGQIDLLPAVFYSVEREKKLLYSADDMGTIHSTLVVPDDDTAHAYQDYDSFQGMRVGVLAASIDGASFRRWASDRALNMQIIDLASDGDLFRALDSGEIDGVAISYRGSSSPYRVVAEFNPMPMYFALPKDRAALKVQLDAAMEQLEILHPSFKTDLYNKYSLVNQSQGPIFTQEQLAYIASAQPLVVALERSDAPYSYVDKNGSMTGAIPEMFKRSAELSGLRFRFLPVDSQEEAIAAVKDGRADIAGKLTDDSIASVAQGIRLTNPYMKTYVTQLTRKGTAHLSSIAVPRALASIYTSQQPAHKTPRRVEYHDTALACFDALRDRRVDAVFLDTVATNYLMNVNRASDYTISALNGCSYALTAGVDINGNSTLYAVLNKCTRHTSAATMTELVIRYSQASSESWSTFINRIPTLYLAVFIIILSAGILFLIILLILLRKRAREERLMTEQAAALRSAEQASIEKNKFLGNVSHDMRTPLNGILGYTDLALQAQDPDTMRDYLGKIRISGRLLLDLVNDTLTISKIENRKFALNPTVVELKDLLNNVATPVCTLAEAKGVNFLVNQSGVSRGYVRVDRVAWQKIFLNLLTNAVKFTPPEGTVEFSVDCRQAAPQHLSMTATVRDTGVGISEDFLPKMFEPFAQEHPAGVDNIGGTGLGLSIVQRFVAMMGGKIDVKSLKGEGATFTVRLPLEFVPDYVPDAGQTFRAEDFDGLKILLCEDNEMNAEILQSILEAKKMQAVWARNGREGAELFAASAPGEFAAIIMDIRMPVMNGYDAARAIRALDRQDAGTIPIIALSADAYDEDVARTRSAGMDAHIAKPIDPQLLYAELSRLICTTTAQ